jgi:hypothetical protein
MLRLTKKSVVHTSFVSFYERNRIVCEGGQNTREGTQSATGYCPWETLLGRTVSVVTSVHATIDIYSNFLRLTIDQNNMNCNYKRLNKLGSGRNFRFDFHSVNKGKNFMMHYTAYA